ncbi:NACHT domain- and WD repeat-containing protein 1 isoform X3 [Pongo pygmaeus]|uniref:NACHT domain- and WD repeat-containing protein 1 isoform X3 n=1 Tax=Pongo pygmaeus TaxID=9600 RepID=UPI0023E28C28|nr:NACHT domain- and WD repeat-containing protein 1 isoform X3 [Pongo pygmaeus]
MVDRLADGCLDTDAQNLLSSLKGHITDMHPGVLKAHHLLWSHDLVNPKNKTHARYLKELGEQFVVRANHQVLTRLRELDTAGQELSWLYQEIRHHIWQSSEVTQTFCGRQELLARLGQQLRHDDSKQHTPLVLFGPPGIGKTALMCKLADQMPRLLGHKTVTILRLLGTSQMSSDARGLLKSICFQVCLAYGLPLPPAQVLHAHTRVVQFFHTLLHTVSCRNFESLVLLLDAMDDLDSVRHARRVPWLPLNCPPRVHLILSACSGALGVLDTLQRVLLDPEAYWEVKPFSGNQGQEMIQLLLAAARRTLSPVHTDLLWASLPECGNPGRLRLAFEEARKWASFTVPVPLATTTEEATHQLCTRLEQTHGRLLVAHVLGYIVSSRHGLSEAELKDVLSLDDEVLQDVYRDWTPPSKELLRFPPLLWVRLRRDLGYYLARRPVDGFTLLAIAHRQLVEVVRERYLSGSERAKRHGILADFFSGTWSQSTKKLITLPLVGKPLNLDRKVAPQPLWFSDTVANLRKLKELPYHLLHSGRLEELKQEVLGSMSWISCRGISGGIEDLLDDFDLCAPHLDSPEVGLVREALQLCRPAVELRGMERSLLYTELLARLHFFATSHPALVGQLCQQAQSWFRLCTHPVLVPLRGFLQPPGGPLRATLSGCHKGITAMAWGVEEKLLVIGTQDGIMAVWDMEEHHVIHMLTGHTGFGRSVRIFLADSRGFRRFIATDLEHEDMVETAVFGTENNLIITGSLDALIQVWSLSKQGTLLDILEGVGAPVSLLACGGTLVASASPQSSSFKVWDLSDAHRSRAPAPFLDRTGLTAVSHNGSYVYFPKIGDKNKVTIWDLAEGEEQDSLDTSSEVRCLEVAEQHKLLFTGLVSGVVLVFPLNSRQDVICIPPPEARKAINCMSLSKCEDRLAIAYDNIVLVLDITPGDPCPVVDGPRYTFYTQLPETLSSVAILTDYRMVYSVTNGDLFLYECANSKAFPLEAHRSRVACIEVSHKEQLVVSGSEDALLCLWDLQTRKWKFEMSYTAPC